MAESRTSSTVLHFYPDGTGHIVHLQSRVKRTVLFSQYHALRLSLRRPLKPSVALIVVRAFSGSGGWDATLIKATGQSRTVPLSVLVQHEELLRDAVLAPAWAASPTASDDPAEAPAAAGASSPQGTTPSRQQLANWASAGLSFVTVKEVSVAPHVYSSTEHLFQQVNEMTDVVHPYIVRILTTYTHNGFFLSHATRRNSSADDRRRSSIGSSTAICASGALTSSAPTVGVAFGQDPSLVIVEELSGTLSVADCLMSTPRQSANGDSGGLASTSCLPGHRLKEPQVAAVLYDALRALRYLHENCRRCHRRVNAANLLLDSQRGKVMLRQSWEYAECSEPTPHTATASSSSAMLSLGLGETSTFAEDVWMVGLTTLEMLLGQTADRFQRVHRVANAISTVISAKAHSPEEALTATDELRRTQRKTLCALYPEVFTVLSDDLFDFLSHCLLREPSERDSAQGLLSHHFLSSARAHTVMERSRALGSIIALATPTPSDGETRVTGSHPNAVSMHPHAEEAVGARPGHRRSSSGASVDDSHDSSLNSSPSTVAAYRSVVRDGTAKSTRSRRAGPTTSNHSATAPPGVQLSHEDRASLSIGGGGTQMSLASHGGGGGEADVSVEDGTSISPSGTWSLTEPDNRRQANVDGRALRSLKAGFLRSMRGPSVGEVQPTAAGASVELVIPPGFQHMLSSFPRTMRQRLGRRIRSSSMAGSIETVGLRAFPLTFTILNPALEYTVRFLETVSAVLSPLSKAELVSLSKTSVWPYDMRRVRHYLNVTGPEPPFEQLLALLEALNSQCKQLDNASPDLFLQLVQVMVLNFRNLEHGRQPFLKRMMALEEDVARRLQQQQRRSRTTATTRAHSAASRSPPAVSLKRNTGPGSLTTTPRNAGRGVPTVAESTQVLTAAHTAQNIAPIVFTPSPLAFTGGDGEEDDQGRSAEGRGNAAFFLFNRWLESGPGNAF